MIIYKAHLPSFKYTIGQYTSKPDTQGYRITKTQTEHQSLPKSSELIKGRQEYKDKNMKLVH
jgi:hypothetical protein